MNKNKLYCAFGLHQFEVYKEEKLSDVRGNIIGKVIINRCSNCGKIKSYKIYTTETNNHNG